MGAALECACAASVSAAFETAESGRPVAAFISVGSIPFLAADGNTYNGFGGIRGQGTGGDRNLVPTIPRNSISGRSRTTSWICGWRAIFV